MISHLSGQAGEVSGAHGKEPDGDGSMRCWFVDMLVIARQLTPQRSRKNALAGSRLEIVSG